MITMKDGKIMMRQLGHHGAVVLGNPKPMQKGEEREIEVGKFSVRFCFSLRLIFVQELSSTSCQTNGSSR